jgi:protein-tyrosine phosphatase
MSAEIYWIADVVRGRLAILGRPRAGDWLADEIADWKAAGLTDIVSLLEDHENHELGLASEAEVVSSAGLRFERFPIADRGVPASSAAAHTLWDELAARMGEGRSVGIHCRAGIGRSGLIAAGLLLRLGVPESEAWLRTSKARGLLVPDTDEQRLWLTAAFGDIRSRRGVRDGGLV